MNATEFQVSRTDNRAVTLVLVTAACALAHLYLRSVELPAMGERLALHADILAGQAESPYRYRVLMPALAETLRRVLALAVGEHAFWISFAVLNVAAISYYLLQSFALFTRWMSASVALAGALLMAAVMPVAFQEHAYQPWSFLEAGLFAHACRATLEGRRGLHLTLSVVATLNRETGVFVAALWPLYILQTSASGRGFGLRTRDLVPGAAWVAVYGSLRLLLGNAPHLRSLAEMLQINLMPRHLLMAAVNLLVLLGPLWFFVGRGLRTLNAELRGLVWIVPPYLVFVAVYGRWSEVRVLLSPLPLVVAAALGGLFPGRPTAAQQQ